MFLPYFTDEPSQKIGKNLILFVPPWVNGTHHSEDTPPSVPFFTGISKASKPSKALTSGEFSTQSMDNAAQKAREAFLSQCMRPILYVISLLTTKLFAICRCRYVIDSFRSSRTLEH